MVQLDLCNGSVESITVDSGDVFKDVSDVNQYWLDSRMFFEFTHLSGKHGFTRAAIRADTITTVTYRTMETCNGVHVRTITEEANND